MCRYPRNSVFIQRFNAVPAILFFGEVSKNTVWVYFSIAVGWAYVFVYPDHLAFFVLMCFQAIEMFVYRIESRHLVTVGVYLVTCWVLTIMPGFVTPRFYPLFFKLIFYFLSLPPLSLFDLVVVQPRPLVIQLLTLSIKPGESEFILF